MKLKNSNTIKEAIKVIKLKSGNVVENLIKAVKNAKEVGAVRGVAKAVGNTKNQVIKSVMKILIVEDEQVLSKVLKEKFEKADFDVKISGDGEVAILDAKSFLPEIIILDLVLPKKSGFEVLKEVKADPETRLIPVIVVSNLGEDGDIKQALNLGAKDYFVKSQHPINEIVEKVKIAITESR